MNALLHFVTLDESIVIFFLLSTLLLGLFAGKNIKTIRDYAIANKIYGTPVLVLTLLATMIGADSTTGMTAQIFVDGLIFALAAGLGSFVSLIILARFVSSKFDNRFEGMLSISDVVGYFYGVNAERFSGLIGYLFCIGIFAAQLTVMGHIAATFLNIPYMYGVLFTSLLVVIYSSFGGIRAVAITDVFQFAVLIVIVPIIANVATHDAGGLGHIFSGEIMKTHAIIYEHPKFGEYLSLFIYWCIPFAFIYPSIIQRYLMTKNKEQAAKITYIYAILVLALALITTCIAFSALVLFPDAEPKAIIPIIIDNLLPTGVKGLAIAGMLAVIMSTADSALNSGGILLAHNFLPERFFKSEKSKLHLMKMCTLLSGILATVIASQNYNISIIILMSQTIFISVSIPLTLGILRFKVNEISFWACTFANIATLIVAHLYDVTAFAVPMLCTVTAFLTFILACYVTNHGSLLIESQAFNSQAPKTKFSIMPYLPTPHNILNYCTTKVKKVGANYIAFGIFCCVNYVVPFFMWTVELPTNYPIMLSLRILAGFLCVGLLLKEFWPNYLKKYFPVYWHFTLMFCLSFVTTTMFFMMGADIEWLINISLAIMLLAMLVDWLSFIFISVLGVSLGYAFYSFFIGGIGELSGDFHKLYLLSYVCIFSSLIGIIFARKKEINTDEKLELMQLLGSTMAHEAVSPFATIAMNVDSLDQIMKNCHVKESAKKDKYTFSLDKEEYKMLESTLKTINLTTIKGINGIEHTLTSIKGKVIADDIEVHNLYECIQDAINEVCSASQQKQIICSVEHDATFYGSYYYMKHVFINLIKNAFKYGGLNIQIEISVRGDTIIFHDNGNGIQPNVLPHIFDRFFTNSSTGTGIGLSFCKMVLNDMGGTIECRSELNKYTEFRLMVPSLNQE